MTNVYLKSWYRNCDRDGWLVLNQISQSNISAYENSEYFSEFVNYLERSKWVAFCKEGQRNLRRAALTLVLWSFCLAIHRDMKSKDPAIPRLSRDRFSSEYMARVHDLVFTFSMGNHPSYEEDIDFCVQGVQFKRGIIKTCLKWLQAEGALYWTMGYNVRTSEDPLFQIGYWAMNLSVLMPFYENVSSVIDRIVESVNVPRTNKFLSKPKVSLRELSVTETNDKNGEKKVRQNWVEIDREETKNFQDLQPVKTIEPYLKRYAENLKNINVSLGCYEDLSPDVRQSVREEWQAKAEEFKRKQREKNRSGKTSGKGSQEERCKRMYEESLYTHGYFTSEKYNQGLRNLEQKFKRSSFRAPHAVFHHVGKLWLVGRIYNNLGVDGVKREFTPCLRINGEYVSQIDIVSSNIQFYVIKKGVTDPHQDFYVYPILGDYGFSRDRVKSLIVSLLNTDEISAIRSYNKQHSGEGSLNREELRLILKVISTTRPYLKKLLNDPDGAKKSIRQESDFMVAVGNELLERRIPYIHHFDALYVPKSKREETLSVMESVSRRMFDNRVIALRWSDNERVDVDNVKIKTYEDDPEVVAKIPKLSKTFMRGWDRIQKLRSKTRNKRNKKQTLKE